jgi:hypothetical protein
MGNTQQTTGWCAVDWADEEGARFGKSLFVTSLLGQSIWIARSLTDKGSIRLPDAPTNRD